MIVHNKPCFAHDEIGALQQVLSRDWVIAGKEVTAFEYAFAEYIGAPYAIAVNNGTAALHLSLLALNIQPGDEIILPTYTASDLLNAIYYVQATPVLVDTAKKSFVIDTKQIVKKITDKTKAMIIPHVFGFPADIAAIEHMYHIPIIEDCAHAITTFPREKHLGMLGKISIFSFYATKLLTTGQGGMLVTQDKQIYDYVRDLISYNGRDNYRVRYNYPMTDIAASIGLVQLKKFPTFCKRRQEIAQKYQTILEIKHIPHFPDKTMCDIVPFRFVLVNKDEDELKKREKLFLTHGIEATQPIKPYELLHRLLGHNKTAFPNAEHLAQTTLSLPIYPCLCDVEIQHICSTLEEIL